MTGSRTPTKRESAARVARVLRIEIEELTEIDAVSRRDMIEVIDNIIAALTEAKP